MPRLSPTQRKITAEILRTVRRDLHSPSAFVGVVILDRAYTYECAAGYMEPPIEADQDEISVWEYLDDKAIRLAV